MGSQQISYQSIQEIVGDLLKRVIDHQPEVQDKHELWTFYTKLTALLKNLNYAVDKSPEYQRLLAEVEMLICS